MTPSKSQGSTTTSTSSTTHHRNNQPRHETETESETPRRSHMNRTPRTTRSPLPPEKNTSTFNKNHQASSYDEKNQVDNDDDGDIMMNSSTAMENNDDMSSGLDRLSKSQLIAKVRALECLVTGLENQKKRDEECVSYGGTGQVYHVPQGGYRTRSYYMRRGGPMVMSRGVNNENEDGGYRSVVPMVKRDGNGLPRAVLSVIQDRGNVNGGNSGGSASGSGSGSDGVLIGLDGCSKKRRGPYKRKGTIPQLSPEQIRNVLEMRKSGRPRECDKPHNSTESRQERVKRLSRERVWRFRERQRIKAFLAQAQQEPQNAAALASLPIAAIQALEVQGRIKKEENTH